MSGKLWLMNSDKLLRKYKDGVEEALMRVSSLYFLWEMALNSSRKMIKLLMEVASSWLDLEWKYFFNDKDLMVEMEERKSLKNWRVLLTILVIEVLYRFIQLSTT